MAIMSPAAYIGGSVISALPNLSNSTGLVNALTGSKSASGSTSQSAGGSFNSASSMSGSQNNAWSNTAGNAATALGMIQAENANSAQSEFMQRAMDFNREEAQKQRDWQERMANTVYTRSVSDMIKAGINPILAASAGLSAASVGSGMSANIASPSAFMGQTFAEQNSASSGSSFGNSSESGGSWNNASSSDWSNSESGLATGLKQMAALSGAAFDTIQSSEALNWAIKNFGSTGQKAMGHAKDLVNEIFDRARSVTPENYNKASQYPNQSWRTE